MTTKEPQKKTKPIRYTENPFIHTGGTITTKKRQIKLAESSDSLIVDSNTGEVKGTYVASYREVDDAEFVKLFSRNIGFMFGLSSYGMRALPVLIWVTQREAINKDMILLDRYTLADFVAFSGVKYALPTFTKGINELEKAQVLAKAQRRGWYYINPYILFNGDRLTMVADIRRKSSTVSKQEQLEEKGQQRLIE